MNNITIMTLVDDSVSINTNATISNNLTVGGSLTVGTTNILSAITDLQTNYYTKSQIETRESNYVLNSVNNSHRVHFHIGHMILVVLRASRNLKQVTDHLLHEHKCVFHEFRNF